MAFVEKILFELIYAGVNITQDIAKYVTQLTYTDVLEGESDDVQVVLDDTEGKWSGPWYPTKKDKMSLKMGYPDLMVNCGTFTVDEVAMQGPPHIVNMKGLAAASNSPIRTKKSRNHEGVTLRQLAQKIADENALTLVDGSELNRLNIDYTKEKNALHQAASTIRSAVTANNMATYQAKAYPVYSSLKAVAESIIRKGYPDDGRYILASLAVASDVVFGGSVPDYKTGAGIVNEFANKLDQIANKLSNKTFSKTQAQLDNIVLDSVVQLQETDIAFLYKIGMEYGIIFSVRDTNLIFTSMFDLARDTSVTIITKADLKSYNIKDGTAGTFKKVKVSYHNPVENEVVSYDGDTESDDTLGYEGLLPNDDTLVINSKAENSQQAETKGKVALHRANVASREGDITIIGNPLMVAGVNFELQDMGKLSGKYQITKSTHTFSKGGGYETSCEIRCIDRPAAGTSGSSSGNGSNKQGTDPTAVYGKKLDDGIYNARDAANKRRTGKAIKPVN